ncbi:GntR family transcriptional regulator [Martelella endophytica]|uniref:GntR family transcriptional regulator n=1 Tax=Martelella endophytica TaxID=1486262 RepID=A0A0D5LLU6_MAREN|nr:GntR family transcriptional regulator [Martelella endophytica]AJY45126.1 GntR family transcriptional regulator [Martelella endophytica]
MAEAVDTSGRRPRVDDIFEYLEKEIMTLRLRPGDKISEAEVAARFGVSRQPVRDAFSRLANMELLLIRPQRATEVKRFSSREIEKARFLRAAVESEVLRRAAEHCDAQGAAMLDEALARQDEALENKSVDDFGALDYQFHQTLCQIAKVDYAFDIILAEKAKVDRLCMLGLSKEDRMPDLIEDHRAIADAVKAHSPQLAVSRGMLHLSRLDETIAHLSQAGANYFDPE